MAARRPRPSWGQVIGVIAMTFFTLLMPPVQNAEQLLILRALPGLGAGGLMPFFMAPHTGSPIGAFVPIVRGKETIGQIEVIAADGAE